VRYVIAHRAGVVASLSLGLAGCDAGEPLTRAQLDGLEARLAVAEAQLEPNEARTEPRFEARPVLSDAFIQASGRALAQAMQDPDADALLALRWTWADVAAACRLDEPFGDFRLKLDGEQHLQAAYRACVPAGEVVSVTATATAGSSLHSGCGFLVREFAVSYVVETTGGRARIDAELDVSADGRFGWTWGIVTMPSCTPEPPAEASG
jgi:hypothetical protein